MATNNEGVRLEDHGKLVFRNQYAVANTIHVRAADRNLYPTNKEGILNRISISGFKDTDNKFFTPESIELAKKKG